MSASQILNSLIAQPTRVVYHCLANNFQVLLGVIVTYIKSLGNERAGAPFLSAVNALLTVCIVCETIPLVISV